jgi:dihydrofolate reductase
MRRMVVVMQTTLNNRIEKAFGVFWEPFPWGEPEQAWLNEVFQGADMWAMSRMMYEAIVPWWDEVAARQIPSDVDELTRSTRLISSSRRSRRGCSKSSSRRRSSLVRIGA